MYFTPDGRSAIVVAEAHKRLDFRDPKTMALQSSLDVPECGGINHADFSIDGRYAIFTCEFAQGPREDRLRRAQGRRLPEAVEGRHAAGHPDQSRTASVFYVADMMADGVFVIDGDTFREIGFIATGKGTHGLYPSRDGRKLYVTNRGSNRIHGPAHGKGSVSVIDFATRKVDVDLADSRRRQPRHGQRQRRRQAAMAIGTLRQRRVRVRHDERRRAEDSGRQGAARPRRVAAARALFARAHGEHAVSGHRVTSGQRCKYRIRHCSADPDSVATSPDVSDACL